MVAERLRARIGGLREDGRMIDGSDRPSTPKTGGERETLTAFLDRYRATLAWKCEGLDPEQLAARSTPPSTLSLLGLVRHMGEVEAGWFRRFHGEEFTYRYATPDNWDLDFDGAIGEQALVTEALAYWNGAIEHAREIVAAHDLDDTFTRPRDGVDRAYSLRWILVHMIEEYARHCGHADLIREAIDGSTGS